jgi:hypothetical protein
MSCLLQCFGDRGPDRARAAGDDRDPSTQRIQCGGHGLAIASELGIDRRKIKRIIDHPT